MNANGISNSVVTQMDQIETDISGSVCCEQSDNSASDPLIKACESDEAEVVIVFTYDQGSCSSTTTTTTVFYDTDGEEKASEVSVEESADLSREMCCNAATDSESSLLLACDPSTEQVNVMYTYGPEGCTVTYDEQTTYANSNGVSTTVTTQTDQTESGISEGICCDQSANTADDPLIEACSSDEPTTEVVLTFDVSSEGGCASTTTTTTVFYDPSGNEKARRVTSEELDGLDEEVCCDAATDLDSGLLLACEPSVTDVNERFTFEFGSCTRTYDVQTTYMNANGISSSSVTQLNQMETDISDAICCAQSADVADDPLV